MVIDNVRLLHLIGVFSYNCILYVGKEYYHWGIAVPVQLHNNRMKNVTKKKIKKKKKKR